MAYQTGSAASATDLLGALRSFAAANGWTEDRWAANGAGYTLSIHKGTAYLHFRSAVNEILRVGYSNVTGIAVSGSTGYDGAKSWYLQPGAPTDSASTSIFNGIYGIGASNNYWLFANTSPDSIWMVVEVSAGVYHHLGFGEIAKYGTLSGGTFFTGSFTMDGYVNTATANYVDGDSSDRYRGLPFWNGDQYHGACVLANAEGTLQWYTACDYSCSLGATRRVRSIYSFGGWTNSLGYSWYTRGPNTLNGIAPMLPVYVSVESTSAGIFYPIGYLPHIRFMNIHSNAPQEIITLGADQWMVFPAHSKNYRSETLGFVIKYAP